jgi:hypothetical protein
MWPLLRQRRALTRHFLDATPRTLALSYAASYALRAHHSSLSSPTPVVSPGLQEDTSHLGICVLHLACNYSLQVRRPHTYVHVSSTGTINYSCKYRRKVLGAQSTHTKGSSQVSFWDSRAEPE